MDHLRAPAQDELARLMDVREEALDGSVVTPVFKKKRNGDYQTVAVYEKNPSGWMARFMIEKRIEDAEGLASFAEDGYAFAAKLSMLQ